MLVGSECIVTEYTRKSKLGNTHTYYRRKVILNFRCDCCHSLFNREKGDMDPKRLSDSFYHVCKECDVKRFAQEKGVEKRKVWDMPVSSLKKISQL